MRKLPAPLSTALVLLPLLLALSTGCGTTRPSEAPEAPQQTVILISIDGFRHDYLSRYDAPHLAALAANGVRAASLIPSFPTKTFPNHYTLVTGLYPAHHGIIANNMYDPVLDASFSLGNRAAVQDARWWGGEPIWVALERGGRKTAPLFWPGSEAPIQGTAPAYWRPYDGAFSGRQRVDQLLEWLDLPAGERPVFLTLYFSEVDDAGHRYGPESDSTAAAVARVDALIGRLLDGLKARGLFDRVNLLVASDHGMAETGADRVVLLDDYVALDRVRVVDWNPVLMLYPEEGQEDAVYEALRSAAPLTVYRRDEVPARLHFEGHRRIPPIVAVADAGWSITSRARYERDPSQFAGGNHGYDPATPAMGALFIGHGPAFKKGLVTGPFQNIHLYNLMTSILDVPAAPNDGALDSVRVMLRDQR